MSYFNYNPTNGGFDAQSDLSDSQHGSGRKDIDNIQPDDSEDVMQNRLGRLQGSLRRVKSTLGPGFGTHIYPSPSTNPSTSTNLPSSSSGMWTAPSAAAYGTYIFNLSTNQTQAMTQAGIPDGRQAPIPFDEPMKSFLDHVTTHLPCWIMATGSTPFDGEYVQMALDSYNMALAHAQRKHTLTIGDVLGSPDAIPYLNQQVAAVILSDFRTVIDRMLGKQPGKPDNESKPLFNLRDTNKYSEISEQVHNAKNVHDLLRRLSFMHGIGTVCDSEDFIKVMHSLANNFGGIRLKSLASDVEKQLPLDWFHYSTLIAYLVLDSFRAYGIPIPPNYTLHAPLTALQEIFKSIKLYFEDIQFKDDFVELSQCLYNIFTMTDVALQDYQSTALPTRLRSDDVYVDIFNMYKP